MNDKPHIVFLLSDMLGWKTYANRLEDYVDRRDDIRSHVQRFSFPKPITPVLKRHYLRPGERIIRHIDPMVASRSLIRRWWKSYCSEFGQPDALHIATQNLAWLFASLEIALPYSVAIDTTRKAMIDEHNLTVWSPADLERETQVFSRACKIYPMSRWAKSSLVSGYDIGENKIELMLPSIDYCKFKAAENASSKKPLQILFIGTDFNRKGGDRLVKWVRGPLQDHVHLHIVGGDNTAPESSGNITNHGFVANPDLIETLLPSMDVFCLPTRMDMSPWVCAEAMAAGLPVIASDIGGIGDFIAHEETGYLIAMENDQGFIEALLDLCKNPQKAKVMGRKGRAMAQDQLDAQVNYNRVISNLIEETYKNRANGLPHVSSGP